MSVKIVALIVSIIMPQAQPDVDHVTMMKDLASCWAAAKEFMDHDRKNYTNTKLHIAMVGDIRCCDV